MERLERITSFSYYFFTSLAYSWPPILFPEYHSFALASLQTVGEGLEERRAALAHMEADSEALSRFVTPGEAGHIREKLTQMRRHWEELKGSVEQLEGQLNQSASYRQRYNDILEQVYSNI